MEQKSASLSVAQIILNARAHGLMIPAFNIPYLPMMEPVVQAIVDQDSFALIETARLEWLKFESQGPDRIAQEFARWGKREYMRLHLDHVPVIDEDNLRVDFLPIFRRAIDLGYESIMIDGSRLPFLENIEAVRQVVELARPGIAVEAELGAVLGHESGPLPSYEELFSSGRGFTDVEEARQFVNETRCDWLSVAIGNIHGAIATGRKDQKKVEARLDLNRLEQLYKATNIPLVLHGGSGIQQETVRQAMRRGIAKINVGTEIRQPYETALKTSGSILKAQEAVYERTCWVLCDFLGIRGIRGKVMAA
jgi:fructose-bisphosphate aldolase class II